MKHLKGKENWFANACRRKLHYIYEMQFSQMKSNLPDIIKEASLKDPKYAFLWQKEINA